MEDLNLKLFSQGMAVNDNGAGGTQQSLPILAAVLGVKDTKGTLEALSTQGFGQTPIGVVGGLWNGKWDKHIQGLTNTSNGGGHVSSARSEPSGGWAARVSSRGNSDDGPSIG